MAVSDRLQTPRSRLALLQLMRLLHCSRRLFPADATGGQAQRQALALEPVLPSACVRAYRRSRRWHSRRGRLSSGRGLATSPSCGRRRRRCRRLVGLQELTISLCELSCHPAAAGRLRLESSDTRELRRDAHLGRLRKRQLLAYLAPLGKEVLNLASTACCLVGER